MNDVLKVKSEKFLERLDHQSILFNDIELLETKKSLTLDSVSEQSTNCDCDCTNDCN